MYSTFVRMLGGAADNLQVYTTVLKFCFFLASIHFPIFKLCVCFTQYGNVTILGLMQGESDSSNEMLQQFSALTIKLK